MLEEKNEQLCFQVGAYVLLLQVWPGGKRPPGPMVKVRCLRTVQAAKLQFKVLLMQGHDSLYRY